MLPYPSDDFKFFREDMETLVMENNKLKEKVVFEDSTGSAKQYS